MKRCLRLLACNVSALPVKLQKEWDQKRNAPFETMLRRRLKIETAVDVPIKNSMVHSVWWKCSTPNCGHSWQARVNERVNRNSANGDCPKCTDNELLIEVFPKVAADYFVERNRDPIERVSVNSVMKVWWQCPLCSDPWQETVSSRVNQAKKDAADGGDHKPGCPTCRHRNDELEKSTSSKNTMKREKCVAGVPLILKECHLLPGERAEDVSLDDKRMRHWTCSKCDFDYQMSVYEKHRLYSRCPQCSGKHKSDNNLLIVQRPDIARSIAHYYPKAKIEKLTVYDRDVVPFMCRSCGSQYRMSVRERLMRKVCPLCVYKRDQTRRDHPDKPDQKPRWKRPQEMVQQRHTATRYLDIGIRN